MERQFNRQYGARSRTFKRGDPVLIRTYLGQLVGWTRGKVLKRVGCVLYQILVGKDTWIRHASRLRKGFADPNHDQSEDLRTLFEMFDLEQPPPRQTITTLDRERRGLVELNQATTGRDV
ncbi:unnamed protein product [Toxocara canis]|uniref:DUF4817 domain-containing protein n=1 Tax=Toxocara canis TaxID=6265 RepID=A0A183V5U6_TOXCA|nr:unnamed protein product [Toxocara canis]